MQFTSRRFCTKHEPQHDQTGFSSANNLQRMFKARFGMTLTDYRKQLQKPQ